MTKPGSSSSVVGVLLLLSSLLIEFHLCASEEQACKTAPDFSPCRALDKDTEYYCPTTRYCEWSELGFRQRLYLMQNLAYTGFSWNYMVVAPWEYTWFGGLPLTMQCTLEELGYDEDKHDCCNGHYEDYDWSDFSEEGYEDVLWAYKVIGYTQELWESGNKTAIEEETWEDYWWYELPEEVQMANKYYLCTNREIWDGVFLTSWEKDVELPGSYHVNTTVITVTPSASPIMYQSMVPAEDEEEMLKAP